MVIPVEGLHSRQQCHAEPWGGSRISRQLHPCCWNAYLACVEMKLLFSSILYSDNTAWVLADLQTGQLLQNLHIQPESMLCLFRHLTQAV